MRNFKIHSIGVFLIVLLGSGCATSPTRKAAKGPSFNEELRHQLVERFKEGNRSLKTMRGEATVRFGSSLFGSRGETAILIKRPHWLRVDGLSDFGLNGLQLVVSNGDLTIYWGSDNRYYRGLAGREQLARYLSFSLDPERMIDLLTGIIPLEDEADYTLKSRQKGKEVLLKGWASELLSVRKGSFYLPLRYTAYDVDGSKDYVVSYDDYKEEGGHWFPNRVVARFWDPRLRIEVRYRGVELNPEIDKTLFELKIPEDAKRVTD